MINKDREYEKMKKHIENEFKVLDKNRDGMISLQEIFDFLAERVINTFYILTLLNL
jgi:Ca2+-binding EF-hand superfamily protein